MAESGYGNGRMRLRTKILAYAGLVVGAAVLAVAVYFGYQFYYATFAATPEKALQEYFAALSRGDYSRMYDMTRGVPGSPQTAGEFAAQVRWLTRETPPRLGGVELEQVGSKGNARYYRAQLKIATADGSYRLVSILVEAAEEGGVWKVSYPFAPLF